jgi:aryl-alcohol dehydrogenase-like predicted oxidoreductase
MTKIATRHLGRNGPLVSALGFGAMGLSYSYGQTEDNEERFKVLDRALELGSTFWDTSDACSCRRNPKTCSVIDIK